MANRRFGSLTVTLPTLDAPDIDLSNITSLESSRDVVQDFRYIDASLRELDLSGVRLITGRVAGLSAQRVRLQETVMDSVEFDGCDLRSLQWTNSKISRVVFRNCKLMGAALEDLSLENVLIEGCKLDYSTFDLLRATGPLAFAKSSLSEATITRCDLSGAHFEACTLRQTEFVGGKYRGTDLRGNDLSSIRGIAALKQIIIDRPQEAEMATALATELDVTFGDTLKDSHDCE